MHIFITGIAGFLGSNLSEYYLKKGFKVSGCDNLVGGSLDNIDVNQVNFYKANCEDFETMKKITKNVDVICHAAAYAHEGLSSFSPVLISSNNVTGSVSVFTAAIVNKIKRIVYCSSMARYGNIKTPFKEDNILNYLLLLNLLSMSKYLKCLQKNNIYIQKLGLVIIAEE